MELTTHDPLVSSAAVELLAVLLPLLLLGAVVALVLTWRALQRERSRRRAEADASAEARALLKAQVRSSQHLFDASTDAVAVCGASADGALRYLDANPAFERLVAAPRAELLGKTPEQTGLAPLRPAMERALALGTPSREEGEWELSVGRRSLRVMMTPLAADAGLAPQLLVILRDVTESQRLEQGLSQAKRFAESMLLKAPVGLGVFRADGSCVVVNEAYARFTGVGREQLLAQRLGEHPSGSDEPLLEQARATLGTGRARHHEAHLVTAADVDLWAERHLVRVVLEEVPYLVVLLVDTTEAHEASRDLERSRAQLERALAASELGVSIQDFSDGTLHWDNRMFELFQVPPTRRGALINLDTWKERCHPEDLARATGELAAGLEAGAPFSLEYRIVLPGGAQRWIRAVATVENDAHGRPVRLVGLNKDITGDRAHQVALEEGRHEGGGLELAHADFDLEVVLREVAGRCEPRAEERGCELVVEVRPEVPPGWRGDPARLGQLLEALVGYAVEHSEELEVRVLLERAIASTGLVVSISGFTPPLSADELGRLFEPAPLGRTPWPTGPASLALARSRRLLQRLRGELCVDGSGGAVQGVRLFLPLEACALPGPWGAGELDGVRTLVVDESEASRRAVEGVLAPCAFEVTPARSGAQALRAMEDAARSGHPFELVLVSSRMEGVPGLEFVRRARLLMGAWGRALVVVLATSGDRERLLRAGSAEGVDAIVDRPVLRAQLLGVLAELQQVQRKVKAQRGR